MNGLWQSDVSQNRTPVGAAPVVLSIENARHSVPGVPRDDVTQSSNESRRSSTGQTRPSLGETWRKQVLRWLSHRRRAGFIVAGGLCALGVAVALSNPADSYVSSSGAANEESPSLSAADTPSPEFSTPVEADGLPGESDRDPRAVVVELALAGKLDGLSENIADVTAEVASRNGDIVLVDVVATVNAIPSSFSVVLVRSANSWVVREVYSSAESAQSLPIG